MECGAPNFIWSVKKSLLEYSPFPEGKTQNRIQNVRILRKNGKEKQSLSLLPVDKYCFAHSDPVSVLKLCLGNGPVVHISRIGGT